MKSPRRWQEVGFATLLELDEPTVREPISKPLNYRQYAGEVELMFVDEPDEVSSQLSDLNEAIACTAVRIEKGAGTAELVGLKHPLICMHDVLKAYKEHGFEVPHRLTAIHKRLEQRRNELDPQGSHL